MFVLVLGLTVPLTALSALLSCGPEPPSEGLSCGDKEAQSLTDLCLCCPLDLPDSPNSGILFFLPQAFSSHNVSPVPLLLCWKWRSLPPDLFLLVFLRLFRSYGRSCQLPSFVCFWNIWAEEETKNRKINKNK